MRDRAAERAGIVLRRARASDAAALSAIARAAKASWGYPAEWLDLWRGDLTITPSDVRAMHFVVAEVGAEPVGLCAVAGEGEARELEHLWVSPAHMGEGIGKALLAGALEHCASRGARSLHIVSDPHALGFYLARGARQIGWSDGVPAPRRLPVLELPVPE